MKKRLGKILLGKPHSNSISIIGSPAEKALGSAVLLCMLLWMAGVAVPMVRTEKLFVVVQYYSVYGFIVTLFNEGEWVLLFLVGVFGIANPAFKLDQLYRIWRRLDVHGEAINNSIKRVDLISKWSMGDVFVVAVGVVIFKTSGIIADADVQPGLYLFAASSIGSMVVAYYLKRSVERHQLSFKKTAPEAEA